MKLKKVRIENFKRIDKLEIDFTDSLGRVLDFIVLAGPNGCGKTTVLDAIAYPLCAMMEMPFPKSTLGLRGNDVIRRGATEARVEFDIALEPDEHKDFRRIMQRPYWPLKYPYIVLDNRREGHFTWTQPPDRNFDKVWGLVKGRRYATEFVRQYLESVQILERIGGLFYFDQERSIPPRISPKHNRITPEVPEVEHSVYGDVPEEQEGLSIFWANIKQHLVDLGVDAKLQPESWQAEYFRKIQYLYNKLFSPRELIGVTPRDNTRELYFRDDENQEYWFDGLSSGEKQCLLFITQFAKYRIHRSIVLIDEVELHLHPTLQLELLKWLPQMGNDNQFIITTHSPYIAEFFPPDSVTTLGVLEKHSDANIDADDQTFLLKRKVEAEGCE